MPRHFIQLVRNQSSRKGVPIRRIVLHTTEGHNRPGVSDLKGLANWFDNPAAQASSHLGIDAEGNSVRMVPDGNKAWTQYQYNSGSLSIEQIGFAAETKKDWITLHNRGLYRVAVSLAHWHKKYPQIALSHGLNGVIQHSALGAAGGGHHDCGLGYPERYVTIWSRLVYYRIIGKRESVRAKAYKLAVSRVQTKYGLTPNTELWHVT